MKNNIVGMPKSRALGCKKLMGIFKNDFIMIKALLWEIYTKKVKMI
jgi:hypothetical protein